MSSSIDITSSRLPEADPAGEREPIPYELTGKWLAWSPDRLKILGHGDTIDEAREMAVGGGDLVISRVPRADLLRPLKVATSAVD